MADVQLDIICGCGYRAKRLEEAVGHSDSTHHRIDIFGRITPTVSKAANKAVSKVNPAKPQSLEEPANASASAIQALRAKFMKR